MVDGMVITIFPLVVYGIMPFISAQAEKRQDGQDNDDQTDKIDYSVHL
jgi:hypothetical protein